ncbi:archease [Streptomyces sp. S07_1.15]|uniref:archease n=1 Tax=Streptomyces sp. S07_1.15 TaxID=2873925 RepID=UPI001D15CC4B|nr:archease [Streptomyces sp. S07_1.15]MCC3654352.1 archease [Streptomyces sp. S07_1.15]
MDRTEAGGRPRGSGHRTVPHTADLRLEAWAETAERCIAEAVRAAVESFADISGAVAVAERTFEVTAATDEDLLVAVLDEAVYRLDAYGEIPLETVVGPVRGVEGGRAATVRCRMADASRTPLIGAVPKAVSLHDLRLRGDSGGWACAVTLDV